MAPKNIASKGRHPSALAPRDITNKGRGPAAVASKPQPNKPAIPQYKEYDIKYERDSKTDGWMTEVWDGTSSEYLSDYADGGLCPVLLGDTLHGPNVIHKGTFPSFTIEHKLGHGSYATVWLAKQVAKDDRPARYLALKVLRSEHSTNDNQEMNILQELGKLHVAFVYEHRPTGKKFLCLGMKLAGSTLRLEAQHYTEPPSNMRTVTGFVQTLVTKVLGLHERGIVHGDLTPSNVAFGKAPNALDEGPLHRLGLNERKSHVSLWVGRKWAEGFNPRPKNAPEYLVRCEGLSLLSNTKDMSQLEIIDFGSAFKGKSKSGIRGTRYYRAPELDVGPYTAKSDLWSLGCVIAFGLVGTDFFDSDDKLQCYKAVSPEDQRLLLGYHLHRNRFLQNSPVRSTILQLLHTLLQIRPAARDVEKVKRILWGLNRYND